MVRVHVRLHLEHEAGNFAVARRDMDGRAAPGRRHGLGRGGVGADALQELIDAEMAQGRAEEHRRHMAFQEGLRVEGFGGAQHQFGVLRSEEHTSELQSLMRISYAVSRLNTIKNYASPLHYDTTCITQ